MPRLRSILIRSASRYSGRSPVAMAPGAGTYHIVYRIDENSRVVHVLDIDHRFEIYHRPQR